MRKKEPFVNQIIKDLLVDIQVTLNGKPAYIKGRLNPYATIQSRDSSENYQWSWEAARRIVAHGGNFES
jgi:hypothetical protein